VNCDAQASRYWVDGGLIVCCTLEAGHTGRHEHHFLDEYYWWENASPFAEWSPADVEQGRKLHPWWSRLMNWLILPPQEPDK
jgi:hypothetical protein